MLVDVRLIIDVAQIPSGGMISTTIYVIANPAIQIVCRCDPGSGRNVMTT